MRIKLDLLLRIRALGLLAALVSTTVPAHADESAAAGGSPPGYDANRACGPNSLYMLLKLSGIDVKFSDVMTYYPKDPGGMSLLELKEAAARFGLTAEVRRCTNDDLRTIPLPVIAHVNYGPTEQADHYIVIHRRLDGESLEVIDGTSGRVQRFLVKRMGNIWEGYLLVPSPVAAGRAVSLGSWALIAQLGLIAACTCLPRCRKFLIPGATDVGPVCPNVSS